MSGNVPSDQDRLFKTKLVTLWERVCEIQHIDMDQTVYIEDRRFSFRESLVEAAEWVVFYWKEKKRRRLLDAEEAQEYLNGREWDLAKLIQDRKLPVYRKCLGRFDIEANPLMDLRISLFKLAHVQHVKKHPPRFLKPEKMTPDQKRRHEVIAFVKDRLRRNPDLTNPQLIASIKSTSDARLPDAAKNLDDRTYERWFREDLVRRRGRPKKQRVTRKS